MTIAFALTGHDKDLGGGFMVRRLLPSGKRQSIGPFIFFDHFGPVGVVPGTNPSCTATASARPSASSRAR
jgi:redox-sensitive bicupin YhaK (pirin superfamily)